MTIYLHDRRHPLHDFNELDPLTIDSSIRPKVTFSLFKTTKTSTPTEPCIKYSEDEYFKSRGHCVDQCKRFLFLKKCKLDILDPNNTVLYDVGSLCFKSYFDYSFAFFNESGDYKPRMYPGIEKCSECPVDCVSFMFHARLEALPNAVSNDLYIKLMDSEPALEIEFSVKLSMLEYIIYIASCTGLWMGFSIFDSTLGAVIKIGNIVIKRKKSIKISVVNQNSSHAMPDVSIL